MQTEYSHAEPNFGVVMPSKRPVYLFVLPWSLRIIGGVNQVVANLARQMGETGQFEPLVLTSDWDASEPIFEDIDGVRTVRWQVRAYRRGMGIKERFAYALWERRFGAKFHRFCTEQNIAVVNVHYPGGIAFTLERALRSKDAALPLLLSFHGSDVSILQDLSGEQKAKWRHLIDRAHSTVTCSNQLAQRLQATLGADLAYQVIYNGVDTEKFIDRSVKRPSAAGNTILHVGKFDRNKGQDVLIEAFSRIAGDFPDAQLHLVGGKGECLDSLRTLAVERGLADRIHFFVDIQSGDMPSYFSRANVFCLPSRQEGFPLVLLEAGACGLPVVASGVGGIPELIEDRETGVLIEPDNPLALAEVLRSFLNDPSAAQELGTRLRRRVSEHFSWINTLQQYEALVEQDRQRTAGALAKPKTFLPISPRDKVDRPRLSV
jgi:glycosyltransferase involved in cell wall biosynthesis